MNLSHSVNRYLIILSMPGMVACSGGTKDSASSRSRPSIEDIDSTQASLDQEKSAKDQSNQSKGKAVGTSSQASGVSSGTVQDSSSTDTQGSSENAPADEPIQITGAFLTCVKSTDLYCAFDVALDQPYQFKQDPGVTFSLEFNNDESRIQQYKAEYLGMGSRWHWKIQVPGGSLPTVTAVNLLLPNKKIGNNQYRQTFLLAPITVGDQTISTGQRGCSSETISRAVFSGASYTRPFKILKNESDLVVTIQKICGVENNAAVVRIMKGTTLFKSERLPESRDNETDFVKKFDNLDEGDYLLEVVPGRNSNNTLDNLFFYDLMLSL